jgi:hypothetical protein
MWTLASSAGEALFAVVLFWISERQEAIRAEVLGGNPLTQGAGDVDFDVKRR